MLRIASVVFQAVGAGFVQDADAGLQRRERTICRVAVRTISLKLIVGPLAVVNMAPEERHDSSARSDAIEPIARVLAHEFKGLAVESPAGAAAAADVYTDVSVSVPNILPGVAIGAGSSCLLIRFDQIWEGTKPGHKYHYPCKFCTMPSSFRAICFHH